VPLLHLPVVLCQRLTLNMMNDNQSTVVYLYLPFFLTLPPFRVNKSWALLKNSNHNLFVVQNWLLWCKLFQKHTCVVHTTYMCCTHYIRYLFFFISARYFFILISPLHVIYDDSPKKLAKRPIYKLQNKNL
jgi:hypothetical protein